MLHADSAASGDHITSEDWKLPILNQERSDSQIELMMKQMRPSVYNLPHNPANAKSFKCNYIKSRVESTRMDYINSQSQNFQFKVGHQPSPTQPQIPLENLAYANSIPLNVLENDSSKLALVNSQTNLRATSASSSTFKHTVGNTYLRNQKLVQQRKKEQQFCYYLQQHRQNKHLLE